MTTPCCQKPASLLFDIQILSEAKLKVVATAQAQSQATLVATIHDDTPNFTYSLRLLSWLDEIGWKRVDLEPLATHLAHEVRLCQDNPERVVNKLRIGKKETFTLINAG